MSWIHPTLAFALPILASLPLGWWMARALDVPDGRTGRGPDALPNLLCRLMGRGQHERMDWKRYATAMLIFNAALFVLTFALLYFQNSLPLNPDGKGSLAALGFKDAGGVDHPGADTAVIFNTACSFVTNTNLQHYSGEQHLTYLGQLAGIVWLQFVTPAAGLAVMLATVRGLRGDAHLGDFYLDLMRSVALLLIPLSLAYALTLTGTGVPLTFLPAAESAPLDGEATGVKAQAIARGPVAALVAVKQIGTNGGGFFGPNSCHPFENPSPLSNLVEITAIVVIPMASIVMAGLMLKRRGDAAVIFGVMLALVVAGAIAAILWEVRPSVATSGLPIVQGPNMEGKEVRAGAVSARRGRR